MIVRRAIERRVSEEAGSARRSPRVDWRALLEANLGTPFTDGNRIEVLRNGVEIFPSMLQGIRDAQSAVDFLTYVYWTGSIARDVASALSDAAKRGVRTRVLLDSVGAHAMDRSLVSAMRQAGASVEFFRPPRPLSFWKADNRTHRKVLVCDGTVGFTGGVGIGEEWEGDARGPSEWRDTHFRIEGPAVRGLRAAFIENWIEATDDLEPSSEVWRHDRDPADAAIQVLRAASTFGWSDIATLLRTILVGAQSRIAIQSAYFVPDPTTRELLCEAAQRGVEVDVLIPGPHADERASQLAGEAQFAPLLEAGVRIWLYQPTMMHAKIVLCDGELISTGTANFNQRSMTKDDEIAISIIHPPTYRRLEEQFEEDREASVPLDLSSWRRRGSLQRLGEWLVRPIRREV